METENWQKLADSCNLPNSLKYFAIKNIAKMASATGSIVYYNRNAIAKIVYFNQDDQDER